MRIAFAAVSLSPMLPIGRHVIIASGKYRGEMGVVTKGGNGYLTVQFVRQVEGLKASEGNCGESGQG